MPTLFARATKLDSIRAKTARGLSRWAAKLSIALGIAPCILLAGLWVVATSSVASLALKCLRIAHQPDALSASFLARLQLLASELAFCVGLTALSFAIMALTSAWRIARIGLSLVQLLCLTSFVALMLAHGYFLETGATLDYTLVAFASARPYETAPIVVSAIGPGLAMLLIGIPLAMLGPSWWIVYRCSCARATQTPMTAPPTAPARLRSYLAALGCSALSLGLFIAASCVRVPGVDPGFAREASVQLASGFWSALHARPLPPLDSRVPARKSGASRLRRLTQGTQYNVVFIVLESARADATTPYAPGLATTPALAQLATEGTLVERAYTVVPHTSKSLVAMLCGFEPRTSTELVESQPLGLPGKCLPKLLREIGYDSAFFQAPRKAFEAYPELIDNLGFERFVAGDDMPQRGFEVVNYFGLEDAVMLGPSQRWLMHEAHEPFIAAYLTNASHHPYVAPKHWPKRRLSANGPKNDYLNAISYVDSVVGRLIEQYKQLGLYERTLFVVLGDHGEGFNEHGMWTHDDILYEEGIRIPLVFRAPTESRRATRVSGPISQLAIVPTVLDVLGLAADGGGYDASSVYARASQAPVSLACFRNAHCLSSIGERYKLIYYYSDRPPLLFDLQRDPYERHNLAPDQPALVQDWSRQLLAWETAVDKLHARTSQLALEKYVQRSLPSVLQHPRTVHFGEFVDLIGFSAESTRPDGAHFITNLYVQKPLPRGYHFALRLSSGFWHSRTLDEQPVRGLYPYARWQPGDYIANLQRSDWPASWSVMELCLELLDADNATVEARAANGERYGCVPLTTLDHKTQREIVAQ